MDNFDTICGYQFSDLVLFARACRFSGITENELHDFVLNYEYAFKLGLSSANVMITEQINDVLNKKGEVQDDNK